MDEETHVQDENSNKSEEVALESTENTEGTVEQTEEVDWKAKAEKAEQLATNYKIRAEKAERKSKEPVIQGTKTEAPALSTKDLYALVDAKVVEDDVSEVEQFARFRGISISEALKTPTMKAILTERKENRLTAQGANTGTSRRSSTKPSDETLLERASKGELPESQDDMVRIVKARKGIK